MGKGSCDRCGELEGDVFELKSCVRCEKDFCEDCMVEEICKGCIEEARRQNENLLRSTPYEFIKPLPLKFGDPGTDKYLREKKAEVLRKEFLSLADEDIGLEEVCSFCGDGEKVLACLDEKNFCFDCWKERREEVEV